LVKMLDLKTIDLIKKETSEPKEITEKRLSAYKEFVSLDLPSQKTESWKYSSAKEIDFDLFDSVVEQEVKIKVKKGEKIVACSIRDAFENNKEILMKYLPATLINKQDKFSAMHSAFWNRGIFIYVPKNTDSEIYLEYVVEKKGVTLSHNLIIIDENSTLKYYEEHSSKGADFSVLKNDATCVFVGESSRLIFNNFQNWQNNVINLSDWKATLSKDSGIDWIFGQFGGKLSRIKIETLFNGEGSTSKTFGVFFGDKDERFDFTTDAYHNVPNTNCNILVKGALDGSSSSVYRGKIKILKNAQQTTSFLSDHSLMLSEKSISNSIPSLEIDANDVKASHGATIGKPDEEELFYLMARGLSRKEAERLIIIGYFSPVLEQIKNQEFRDKFEKTIEEKKNV
jgi:Fe-S cluster assembly protein SufD